MLLLDVLTLLVQLATICLSESRNSEQFCSGHGDSCETISDCCQNTLCNGTICTEHPEGPGVTSGRKVCWPTDHCCGNFSCEDKITLGSACPDPHENPHEPNKCCYPATCLMNVIEGMSWKDFYCLDDILLLKDRHCIVRCMTLNS